MPFHILLLIRVLVKETYYYSSITPAYDLYLTSLLCSSPHTIYQLNPQSLRYLTVMFRQNVDRGCRFPTLWDITIATRVKCDSFGSLLIFKTDIRKIILHCLG